MEVSILTARSDMRRAYCSGGAGILASALAWTAAACVAVALSAQAAVWTLLVGGTLIHPVSVLMCRALGATGAHARGNPLGALAVSSTLWLIFCLPLAYGLALQRTGWFFPAMLLVIGGRYLAFATLYGMRLYWALGLSLAAAGVALAAGSAPAAVGAGTGAVLEAVYAAVCLMQHRRWAQSDGPLRAAPLNGAAGARP